MFLPVEGYEYDWDEDDYVFNSELKINPMQIVKIKPDYLFEGDYTCVGFVSGEEIIVTMNIDEFEKYIRYNQLKIFLS
jgi:hypothetical protein